MQWSKLHTKILKKAFEDVLGSVSTSGNVSTGAMAFVRCLEPEVVEMLVDDDEFAPSGWQVRRVADCTDTKSHTITADQAVELREDKKDPVLLLVDTSCAGAGLDGIYSATREIDESSLFAKAIPLARKEITRSLSKSERRYAEQALKKARGYGNIFSVSRWTEFDFLVRVAADKKHPGEYLYLIGLWPVYPDENTTVKGDLELSRMFVDYLLGTVNSGMSPTQRIETLKLLNPSDEQVREMEHFLWSASTKPLSSALSESELANKKCLWVNKLQVEGVSQTIHAIELSSWRTNTGKIAKWSGLVAENGIDSPPVLVLDPDAEQTGHYSKLEVRWKTRPNNLKKNSVRYRVNIMTDMEEELASREVYHSSKKEEKCRFTNDDFSELSEDALISGKVVVSVIGNDKVKEQESEEFVIRFGHQSDQQHGGIGRKVRTFSEGLIELNDRELVSTVASSVNENMPVDSKGFMLLRTPQQGKSFRVYRSPLIDEVEKQWIKEQGAIGRWRVKVRPTGSRLDAPEFIPYADSFPDESAKSLWERAVNASCRMANRFSESGGGVSQIYDQNTKIFDTVVKEYLLAWTALLDNADPSLALANTVEVQSIAGQTIGLIVLPSHPIRVAWHTAFDNLAFYAAFEQQMAPKEIREELNTLDGAMFPSFLPGLKNDSCFVFADMLGFHTVGMIPDTDKEPKAALAILARTLGDSQAGETAPTVGKQSADVLSKEIVKYIECHNTSRLLHIHSLRPGDGMTIARALGRVYNRYSRDDTEETGDDRQKDAPTFVLELYPSEQQRGVAGRFIGEVREKRRCGAGSVASEDRWMFESSRLQGVNLPRLRWARKNDQNPKSPAHLAVAFDTFESRVVAEQNTKSTKSKPYHVFGLLSFFEREYSSEPSPTWRSILLSSTDGEKHPSDRTHTERLIRIQKILLNCVARSLGVENGLPILQTNISQDKERNLQDLHRLCDWVITLDRNAGIEYFDSPRDNKEIYDAYVIDCVPEREDLGCLQLITSTSNIEEVQNLLDDALDQMGLSRSRRNAEFLLEHIKELSGRLAIRLTGQKAPTAELIALALSHANCIAPNYSDSGVSVRDGGWLPLDRGFFIPVDDVRDLLPPVSENDDTDKKTRPDLIYVTAISRKGLVFRFVEVKYRRHLRSARSSEILASVKQQTESLHKRWDEWYSHEDVCSSFRAIRRAKLARVLHFYADKAYRHHLAEKWYKKISFEIDNMVKKGGEYAFAQVPHSDRGWVFCPEYMGKSPLKISPAEWNTWIFLFGPNYLPDSEFCHEQIDSYNHGSTEAFSSAPISKKSNTKEKTSDSGFSEQSPDVPSVASQTNPESGSHNEANRDFANCTPLIRLGTNLLTDVKVCWQPTIKGNPHLLIAGLPGMGKTTCLLNLCTQMLDADIHPILFSYHQDIDDELQKLVSTVRFIDFNGLGFNPLQVINRDSPKAYLDVAAALRDIFVAIFPELGDIQGERIRKAIKESFIEKGWNDPDISRGKLEEPAFGRFVEILRDLPKPDKGLKSLLVRLEELSDYNFFDLADATESLWDSNDPVLIRIHKTQNDNLQKAFAALVFYGLYKDMFRRGTKDRITHAVIFDEAHRAAKLKLIPTMAKECRKYGISLVLASQEAKDFNASLFSAVANYLVLRLTEADARALVHNVSSSDQEKTLINRIKQMEKYKALYFSETRKKPARLILSLPRR